VLSNVGAAKLNPSEVPVPRYRVTPTLDQPSFQRSRPLPIKLPRLDFGSYLKGLSLKHCRIAKRLLTCFDSWPRIAMTPSAMAPQILAFASSSLSPVAAITRLSASGNCSHFDLYLIESLSPLIHARLRYCCLVCNQYRGIDKEDIDRLTS
jgi:hypothetical protein